MSFLFFIVAFVLVIVFVILTIFGGLVSAIFNLFRGNRSGANRTYRDGANNRNSNSQNTSHGTGDTKKIFSKDEGEYVNFEEID